FSHDVAVVDFGTGKVRTLVEDAAHPRYSPTGHLLFGRRGTLYAAPFDLERLALAGTPLPILEDVLMWNSPAVFGQLNGLVYYDLAREGTLLFSPLEARLPKRTLVWVDRRGGRVPVSSMKRSYWGPVLSTDGRRLGVSIRLDAESTDAYVLDLDRDAWSRVTSEGAAFFAGWLPDDERFLY